ncbi:MAG: hypothetical protein IPQ07_13955 [Myxococcales bacterium]|nr:hypothetical protein [Myxococcales bacterium]
MRSLVVGVVALVVLAAVPRAEAECAQDADRLRSHLEEAATGVRRWNTGWAIAFGGAAVLQATLAVTETKPFGTFDQDYKETMYVGAAKATIGAASRLVLPLRVSIPTPSADRCVELAALRDALATIARKERRTFWLTHLGGFALNVSGALLLWHRRSFKVGAISFLMSFPVGPLSAYTMPRRSWHLYRREAPTWSVGVGLGESAATLNLVGQL